MTRSVQLITPKAVLPCHNQAMKSRGITLSEAVMRRRGQLGRTQEELAKAADLSVDTIQAIELGRRSRFKSTTKAALEGALGWEPGSVDAVAAGDNPTLAEPHANNTRRPFPMDIDPMTASHADLGRVADWVSSTAREPALGARWMRRVLDRRADTQRPSIAPQRVKEANSRDVV